MIDIGVIGGTGFYRFFASRDEVRAETPYGPPSAPVTIAEFAGRTVGFVPRHGRHHEHLPHRVPYRANLAALKELGASQIVGFNVVGSLSPQVKKGDFLVMDQFIDVTWGRAETIFDGSDGAHADLADPYCGRLRALVLDALRDSDETIHDRATVLVINGPRFQTKAENRWYSTLGADAINMTQSTEAMLARELELCYVNLSYCTDYGVIADELAPESGDEPIVHQEIVDEFQRNLPRVERVVAAALAAIPPEADCRCRHALDGCRVAT
ncbi:MAG TPA: MTAP family purine nucleoside phosphorylase [Gaiellaceae bacterium]|nr:MTAP family purine nucleoside phosphorylase [Gaiellaceae bacterium]